MPAAFGRALGTRTEAEGSGTQTTVLTTGAAHNAGESIRVAILVSNSSAVVASVTDSAGNTYAARTQNVYGGTRIEIWSSSGAVALASGGTITVTTGGIVTRTVIVAACCDTGLAAETNEATDGATSAGISLNIDPTTSGGIVYGAAAIEASVGVVDDSNWTSVAAVSDVGSGRTLLLSYKLTTGIAETYEPDPGASVDWAVLASDFGETPPTANQRLPLLGVS